MSESLLDIPAGVPDSVPANSRIYKDDCMYTFDTPENNDLGLDVDLKSYQAFLRTDEYNFTFENYAKTGNNWYLNINKTLKPEEERNKLLYDENGQKSQKLQKLEVREVPDDELYDTKLSIYDAADDISYPIEKLTLRFQNLVNEILTANSSNRNDEIKQWEQEIFPCEHSVDVEQFDVGTVDLSRCAECELTENLWICLHCGTLGCGRQQFGTALKGNSHALSHFEKTDHPVAVKLGSLSADSEDSCDVYCYRCNDEVKVPNLAEKLLRFGLDLKSTVKTEKSLVELNIDQNMNYDFKLEGPDGSKLVPVYGKGLTGFLNLGNSCYLNSVVQSLFDLESYQNYFADLSIPDTENPARDLKTQLLKIYDGLLSGRYSKPGSLKGDDYQLGLKPSSFKNLIGENHEEFKTQRQQDAFEFLIYLLDKIDNEFGLSLNKELNYLFTSKTVCFNCKHGSLHIDLADNLSVNIEDKVISLDEDTGKKQYEPVNFIDCFRAYCANEAIEGYRCDNCGSDTAGVAIKSGGFRTFPNVLIVNAKRIKLENWVPVKIDVPIEIPDRLDISEFKAPVFASDEVEDEPDSEDTKGTAFEPSREALDTLLAMGFPETRCLKALFNTGNNSAEDAMNWLFAHMEDVDIDEPFDSLQISPQQSASASAGPSQDAIDNLTAMGFSQQLAKKALVLNGNDVNSAVEWLFTNPDDDGVIVESGDASKAVVNLSKEKEDLKEQLLESGDSTNGKYELQSVICHKGTSPHTGHYVVFIKKVIDGQEKWVLFNDEKVVVCGEDSLQDMRTNGYVYFFKKVQQHS